MSVIKLAELTRGPLVESIHRGVYAVVDAAGHVIAAGGDISYVTYLRSAAKPMQALPVVESGAATHYGLEPQEIAILAASHSGEGFHRQAVRTLLEKLDLTPEALQCGAHPPFHRSTAKALIAAGRQPGVLHCSCSGKHAGMLALCQYRDWPLEDYHHPEHPVQQEMLRSVAEMADVAADSVVIGIDGCGVPVFGLSMYAMAHAYARFSAPRDLGEKRQQACLSVTAAMMQHPQLVAGTGRLCTDLMQATGGRIVAKDGAEGVFCFGIPEKGWGVAVKVEDGSYRALDPIVFSLAKQLGVLDQAAQAALEPYREPRLLNFRKEIIGSIRSLVNLS